MYDLIGNWEDMLSHNESHLLFIYILIMTPSLILALYSIYILIFVLLNPIVSSFENIADSDQLASEELERRGSVVDRFTRDRRAVGSSLIGVTALCP